MNSTNRGLNRFLLLVVGLLLLVLGAGSIALAAVPSILQNWKSQADSITRSAPDFVAAPAVGQVSLLTVVIGVVAVVLALLLILFIVRHGQGRTSRVIDDRTSDTGRTLIDLGVPKSLLAAELDDRDEFVSTRISAYEVKGTPTLKVSVQCRRGVSPVEASRIVTEALYGLDEVLGTRLPAMVQVTGGFRSRTASRARLA